MKKRIEDPRGPSIRTFTGGRFYPTNPRPEDFCIEDIAHALSNVCRFGGHVPVNYNVAQHSVICSHNVPRQFRLNALIHDASEGYVCDMPSPIKHLPEMAPYRVLEARVMDAIYTRFGLTTHEPIEVKVADIRTLLTEKRDLIPQSEVWVPMGRRPFKEKIIPWSAPESEKRFLERYYEIINDRN